jgi:hypothetical protein
VAEPTMAEEAAEWASQLTQKALQAKAIATPRHEPRPSGVVRSRWRRRRAIGHLAHRITSFGDEPGHKVCH